MTSPYAVIASKRPSFSMRFDSQAEKPNLFRRSDLVDLIQESKVDLWRVYLGLDDSLVMRCITFSCTSLIELTRLRGNLCVLFVTNRSMSSMFGCFPVKAWRNMRIPSKRLISAFDTNVTQFVLGFRLSSWRQSSTRNLTRRGFWVWLPVKVTFAFSAAAFVRRGISISNFER